jgi:hypothetical protein
MGHVEQINAAIVAFGDEFRTEVQRNLMANLARISGEMQQGLADVSQQLKDLQRRVEVIERTAQGRQDTPQRSRIAPGKNE